MMQTAHTYFLKTHNLQLFVDKVNCVQSNVLLAVICAYVWRRLMLPVWRVLFGGRVFFIVCFGVENTSASMYFLQCD